MRAWRLLLLVLIGAAAFPAAASGAVRIGLGEAQLVQGPTSVAPIDPDEDGLSSRTESRRTRTNPRKFDTDSDGFSDGDEVLIGTNPRNPLSRPLRPPESPQPPQSLASSPSVPAIPPEPPSEPEEPPPDPEEPPLDTAPPQTTINDGPADPTTSTSASFDFSASEAGSSFQCQLDSGSWGACSSPRNYSSLALGSHTFSVKATDGTGNTDATPATRSWTVEEETPPPDTTPPQTLISSGPAATTTSTSAIFNFLSSESGSKFECKLDSAAWGDCTSPQAYSSLALGGHTFSVKATDGAGNTDATPAGRGWTIVPPESANCTQTLGPGANLASAISGAAGEATICLDGGTWSFEVSAVDNSSYVTVRSAEGTTASLGHSVINGSSHLRLQDLRFTGGVEMIGDTDHIDIRNNELTGSFGIRANGDQASFGTKVTDVTIDGNNIHDLDYTGSQGTADGYGITAVNGVERFTIANNTIESVAADYIQSASPVDFSVVNNTLLGPTLVGDHPQEHQDLWQIFGGGEDIVFADNVARDTGTHESLLFQEGRFTNVVIENNLFDHDSRGYTCQLYQSTGMVFRDNTVVGSHWGCLFRDEASSEAGSNYQVDHNVFADTEANSDVATEGRAGSWGTYDYNVSSDGSAGGSHSVRNWSPSWVDTVNYTPIGLSFSAGYRP